MIVLYDPVCSGTEHAPFNAALLATFDAAYPHRPMVFFGEAEHLQEVRGLLWPDMAGRIQWRELKIPARHERKRWPMDRAICATVFREAAGLAASHVVACSTTESSLAAVRLQSAFRRLRFTVAVVHHGRLATLMGSRSTRALLGLKIPSGLRHIVLGCGIRRAVLRGVPSLAGRLFAIHHPYLFRDASCQGLAEGGPLRFGFLGLGSKAKGIESFARLSAEGMRAEFEIVGQLAEDCRGDEALRRLVAGGAAERVLGRALYEERVAQLSFAVFPYERAAYELVSSGAILDAFAALKPCIVLRNPVFEEYFAAMGDIGYLCEDFDHLRRVVREIVERPPVERYALQCASICRGRRIFEPASVAAELRAALGAAAR